MVGGRSGKGARGRGLREGLEFCGDKPLLCQKLLRDSDCRSKQLTDKIGIEFSRQCNSVVASTTAKIF